MTPENFCYWIQGMIELREDNNGLTIRQVQIIEDHLALVFDKVTPDRSKPDVPTPTGAIKDYLDPDNIEKVIKDLDELEEESKKWPWLDNPLISPSIHNMICSDKACSDSTFCSSDKEYVTNEDLKKLVKSFSKKNFPKDKRMC